MKNTLVSLLKRTLSLKDIEIFNKTHLSPHSSSLGYLKYAETARNTLKVRPLLIMLPIL